MRFAAGLLTGMLLMVQPAEVPVAVVWAVDVAPAGTPVADSMVDVVEAERQGECLWVWMREQQVEFTLESVMAAGYWTDALGGACYLIGEDDE